MELSEFYTEIRALENAIKNRGLRAEVDAHFNWIGDELLIRLIASEPFDDKGYWRSERSFSGVADDAETLIGKAVDWVHAIPGEEDRAIELMIKKLNEIVGKLPKGHGDVAQRAWEEIHKMLVAKAETLAKNGLPSPARISEIRA